MKHLGNVKQFHWLEGEVVCMCVYFYKHVCGVLVAQSVCVLLICVSFFEIPWTVACQVPLSMEFSRQKYWSGL